MGTSVGRLLSGRNFAEWEHWGRPQDVTLKSPQDVIFQRPKDVGRGSRQDVGRERSLVLHRGPYGDVHRTSFLWA